MTTQKAKAKRKSASDLKNLPENSAECLGSSRERCWGYMSINENAPEKLLHLPPNFWNYATGTLASWKGC